MRTWIFCGKNLFCLDEKKKKTTTSVCVDAKMDYFHFGDDALSIRPKTVVSQLHNEHTYSMWAPFRCHFITFFFFAPLRNVIRSISRLILILKPESDFNLFRNSCEYIFIHGGRHSVRTKQNENKLKVRRKPLTDGKISENRTAQKTKNRNCICCCCFFISVWVLLEADTINRTTCISVYRGRVSASRRQRRQRSSWIGRNSEKKQSRICVCWVESASSVWRRDRERERGAKKNKWETKPNPDFESIFWNVVTFGKWFKYAEILSAHRWSFN